MRRTEEDRFLAGRAGQEARPAGVDEQIMKFAEGALEDVASVDASEGAEARDSQEQAARARPGDQDRVQLSNAFLRACPRWKAQDLEGAQDKLQEIGITRLEHLSEGLREGDINQRLQQRGRTRFSPRTLECLESEVVAPATKPMLAALERRLQAVESSLQRRVHSLEQKLEQQLARQQERAGELEERLAAGQREQRELEHQLKAGQGKQYSGFSLELRELQGSLRDTQRLVEDIEAELHELESRLHLVEEPRTQRQARRQWPEAGLRHLGRREHGPSEVAAPRNHSRALASSGGNLGQEISDRLQASILHSLPSRDSTKALYDLIRESISDELNSWKRNCMDDQAHARPGGGASPLSMATSDSDSEADMPDGAPLWRCGTPLTGCVSERITAPVWVRQEGHCFLPETLLWVGGGNMKQIGEVREGDTLRGLQGKQPAAVKTIVELGRRKRWVVECDYIVNTGVTQARSSFRVTRSHPVPKQLRGAFVPVPARDLQQGDRVHVFQRSPEGRLSEALVGEIEMVSETQEETSCYQLELEDPSSTVLIVGSGTSGQDLLVETHGEVAPRSSGDWVKCLKFRVFNKFGKLETTEALRLVTGQMKAAGHDTDLGAYDGLGGAKMFVEPDLASIVVQALQKSPHRLTPRHVVVSKATEPKVLDAVQELNGQYGLRGNKEIDCEPGMLDLNRPSCLWLHDDDLRLQTDALLADQNVVVVKRTFLSIRTPVLQEGTPSIVTQSTSDARKTSGERFSLMNPRRDLPRRHALRRTP